MSSASFNPDRALQAWWAQHTKDTNARNWATLSANYHKFAPLASARSPRKQLSPLKSRASPRLAMAASLSPRLLSPRTLHPAYQPPSFLSDPPSARKKATDALPPISAGEAAAAVAEAPAPEAAYQMTAEEQAAAKKKHDEEVKSFVSQVETAIYAHHTNMYKAFQKMDLDNSGRLNKKEIMHALRMWNVPAEEDRVDMLMGACDMDGDGGISYEEFCDNLVRETVSIAAMGKRGMQSKEAMGVDAQEWLAKALGHGATPVNVKMNEDKELANIGVKEQAVNKKEVVDAHKNIVMKFKDRFKSYRRGFRELDHDKDGFISRPEFEAFLVTTNQNLPPPVINAVVQIIDVDANEMFDYQEFERFVNAGDVLKMDRGGLQPAANAPKLAKGSKMRRDGYK